MLSSCTASFSSVIMHHPHSYTSVLILLPYSPSFTLLYHSKCLHAPPLKSNNLSFYSITYSATPNPSLPCLYNSRYLTSSGTTHSLPNSLYIPPLPPSDSYFLSSYSLTRLPIPPHILTKHHPLPSWDRGGDLSSEASLQWWWCCWGPVQRMTPHRWHWWSGTAAGIQLWRQEVSRLL